MRKFLRFPFSKDDQEKIDPVSIIVDDIEASPNPQPYKPYPQSMSITFSVKDINKPPPQVRPLIPGQLAFIPDPKDPRPSPDPDVDLTFDAFFSKYEEWNTRGTLMIRKADRDVLECLYNYDLVVVPNRFWYSPVTINREFLLNFLVDTEQREPIPIIPEDRKSPKIDPTNPIWKQFAVSYFLKGVYFPSLNLGEDAADDEVIKYDMPTVEVNNEGKSSLIITAGRWENPRDDKPAKFKDIAAKLGFEEKDQTYFSLPAHPINGIIPARHVYTTLQSDLIDGKIGNPVVDKILYDFIYYKIRYTRTWLAWDECSAYLPLQKTIIKHNNEPIFSQRLPSHGLLFIPESPALSGVDKVDVTVEGTIEGTIDHTMLMVDGSKKYEWPDGTEKSNWQEKGTGNAIEVKLLEKEGEDNQFPHIILRRRMRDEMFIEPSYNYGADKCTYISLRKTIRALVNNRICGGRLSHRIRIKKKTKPHTVTLMSKANVIIAVLKDNKPNPFLPAPKGKDKDNIDHPFNKANAQLQNILDAFFPKDPPFDNEPEEKLKLGSVAYHIWQTHYKKQFEDDSRKHNYLDRDIGCGAPGALVVTELAKQYDFEVPIYDPSAGIGIDEYINNIVGEIMTGLEPGALIQLWQYFFDFANIKNREVKENKLTGKGHSVVFVKYDKDSTGQPTMHVIDNRGVQVYTVHEDKITKYLTLWTGEKAATAADIWIGANWDE